MEKIITRRLPAANQIPTSLTLPESLTCAGEIAEDECLFCDGAGSADVAQAADGAKVVVAVIFVAGLGQETAV